MKKHIIKSVLIVALLFSVSCEEYLDKAPESTLTMEEAFKDFDHAQGFVEEMYAMVVDYVMSTHTNVDHLFGDDAYFNAGWSISRQMDQGNLNHLNKEAYHYLGDFKPVGQGNKTNEAQHRKRPGVFTGSNWGIRKANLIIENIDLMVGATEEEKNVILGQAFFFRAFFHNEIMKFWGRYPYVKTTLVDDYQLPRPATYKECALEANEDYKKAIDLLPVNWDDESYGKKTLGQNKGRITKGAAYAFQGKNLLFAASPLMNGSTDTYDYDQELCAMAVDAFAKVLELDDLGVYELAKFEDYEEVFWKVSKSKMWAGSTEYIFNGPSGDFGWLRFHIGAQLPKDMLPRGGGGLISPTHNFIHNNFGMSNGLSIEDDLSGVYGTPLYDPTKPFENRDPRFYKWITIDGDILVTNPAAKKDTVAQLYIGGYHRGSNKSQTGYFYKKFFPTMHSKWNNLLNSSSPMRLHMRLTDVYLMYAEALHAANNSATAIPSSYNLSAEQAINKLRVRAGIPTVPGVIVSNPNKFMDELRRERAVELSYEAHRWVDLRRWVLAHLDKYTTKTALNFDKGHTYFEEVVLIKRLCEYPKHYWVPFETSLTQLYEGFPQNPGW